MKSSEKLWGTGRASVHEGDPLGLSIHFSEIPDRVIPEDDWFVTIPFIRTELGGARPYGADYWASGSVKVYRNRGYYWAGFQFSATADSVVDPGESVLFEFGALPPGFVAGEPSTLEVTILDGPSSPPTPSMVTLSVSPDSVSEGAGSTPVTVTGVLNAARDSDTQVQVSVDNGTAIGGTDFATVNDFTLTIPANDTRGTASFNLVPTDDDVDEIDETLLVMGSATGLAVDSATMTITDNDAASTKVTLSVNPSSFSEGAGSTTVTVTGTLDEGARTSATPVTVSVDSGTATAGTDFATVNSFTLTIPANQTAGTQTFALIPTDDDVAEGAETATVSGSASGLTVDPATLTITDNDTASTKVALSVDPAGVSEGAGSTTLTVTGRLDGGARTSATPVTVSVDSGTATAGTDFATVNSFTLTIPANATSGNATFTLNPTDDDVAEGAETATVSGSASGLTVDPATLTITDNDTASTKVALSIDPAGVSEGAGSTTLTVTGRLDGGARTSATPVTVSVDSGTATAGTDFATVNSFTLTIPANQTAGTQTFALIPTDDDVAEGAETATVSGSASGLTVDPATLTITDNDTASTKVTLSVDPASVSEGAGSPTLTVTGRLDGGARTSATPVTVSVDSGTATAGTDFATVNSFTLTIPANQTAGTQTFALIPTDDNVAEGAETATVSGSASGLTVDPATLTITDNDTASTKVALSVDPAGVSEGAGSTTLTVTGRLDGGARTSATPVTVSVDSGTATAGTDFATVNSFTLTIPANQTAGTQTFALIPTDDDVAEGAETATVSGSASGLTVDPATLTITDNDTASTKVALSVDPASVSEGAGSTTLTVTGRLDGGARTSATPVTVSVDSGTATAGTDFATVNSFTLTIPANQTAGTQTFALIPTDDNVAEGAETATVSGSASGLTVDPATLTITDNDTASTKVALSVDPAGVSEGAGSTTLTVTGRLDGGARTSATPVTVSVDSGTATAGTDFATVNSFTLTIPANQTAGTQTFALIPTDDDVAEGAETATVSGSASGLTVDPATLTITDNDTASTKVTLSVDPASVSEGGGSRTVTVTGTLDGGALTTATVVRVSVGESGTAVAGTDFETVTSFDLTIAATSMTGAATFDLVPTDDEVAEGAETVAVRGTTGDLSVDPATVTIADDDAAPTEVILSVNPTTVNEDAGSTQITVTGTLDGAALTTATVVRVSVGDSGTAVAGTDFETVTGFDLTIAATAMTGAATFDLVTTDDEVAEGAETVAVSGSATGFTVDPATVTIIDDDATPTKVILSVNPTTVNEDDGSTQITVTGTLDGAALTTATVVRVSVGDSGTAVAGTDFETVTGFDLTIAATAMTGAATFDLVTTDDEVAEGAETVAVSGSATGFTVDPATVTIIDDDATPTKVILSVNPATVNEDDGSTQITVTGTLDGAALTTATVVRVSVGESGTAVAGTDFETVTSFDLTIAATAMKGAATFNLVPTDDEVAEGAETVAVSGTTGDLSVDPATVTIVDDDATPTKVILSVNPATVNEDDGSTQITVTGTLDGAALTTATVVRVSVGESGTAVAGTDFETVTSFDLTIAATAMKGAATFNLVPTDDEVAEGAETVAVSGSATGFTVDPATVTIIDDDATPTKVILSVNPTTVNEDDGSTQITVTGTLDGAALTTATVVRVSVGESGTAVAGTDFETVTSFDLTIAVTAMKGAATFDLVPTDDEVAEGAETVAVSGSATRFTVDPATVTIIDDDATPTKVILSVNPATVNEDAGSTQITVTGTLDGAALTTATVVRVSVGESGTAVAGTDFETVTSFDLTIAATAMKGAATFNLVPTDDEVAEGAETVAVSGSATGFTVDPATVTIIDDDATPATKFEFTTMVLAENGGESEVSVNVDRAASEPVTVKVEVKAESAEDQNAFTLDGNPMLTIPAGQMKSDGSLMVTAVDDTTDGPNKELMVTGSVMEGPEGVTPPAPMMLTIADDDDDTAASTKVTLAVAPSRVSESAGETVVTVTGTLDGGVLSTATTVTVSVAGGTATADEDFSSIPDFLLTIEADEKSGSATFTLTPEHDTAEEDDETLIVSGTTTSDLTVDSATMRITDDDGAAASTTVTLSAEPAEVAEGAGATVVTVTGALDGAVRSTATTVTVSVADGAATAGEDFATVSDFTLTIEADEPSGSATFTLTPEDDAFEEDDETLVVSGTTSDLTVESATVTITDDDDTGASTKVTLSAQPAELSENAGATAIAVTGTLDGAVLSTATTVTVSVAGETAAAGDDFSSVSDFTLTIEADEPSGSATFTLTPVDDAAEEDDETLVVSGTTSDLTVDPATLTITDDDEDVTEPPTFVNGRYTFTLREHQDGRETPVPLGVVAAHDPDDQPLTYTLAAGDATRFVIGPSTGAVTYVGPGEDFEAGPPRYELRVTARDSERFDRKRCGGSERDRRARGAGGVRRHDGDARGRVGGGRRAGERPRSGRGPPAGGGGHGAGAWHGQRGFRRHTVYAVLELSRAGSVPLHRVGSRRADGDGCSEGEGHAGQRPAGGGG